MKHTAVLFSLAAVLPGWSSAADPDTCFEVTSQNGEVRFEVEQAGATFGGAFLEFGGTLCMRGERITAVNAWINPASVETGLPELDTALKSDEFFAVDAHPRATFDGDRVEAHGNPFIAHGTLEVKGIRKPIDVPFQLARQSDGHQVSGSFEIHRLDFNVGTGEWADTQWIADVTTVTFTGTLRGPVAR